MKKLIAAMNVTLDGFCNHEAGIADEEIHQYYSDMLRNADSLIYGRTTYQLMENHWPDIVKEPTGNKAMDDFAVSIDNIPKIVYSRTLQSVSWKNSSLKHEIRKEEILELKEGEGNPIFVGSPGMIATFTELDLIDEYRICIIPKILGQGLPLWKNITHQIDLELTGTRTFGCGVVGLYYERKRD